MISVSFVQETGVTEHRITGNFCGAKFLRIFFIKKKKFNFCGLFFLLLIENLGTEKRIVLQETTTEAMLR